MDVKQSDSGSWYPGAPGFWVFRQQWYPNGPPPPPSKLSGLRIEIPVRMVVNNGSRKNSNNSTNSDWESIPIAEFNNISLSQDDE